MAILGWGAASSLLEEEEPRAFLGLTALALGICLFSVYSTIALYQSGLLHVYLMLRVIKQCYFIFLEKALAIGSSLTWFLYPFHVSTCPHDCVCVLAIQDAPSSSCIYIFASVPVPFIY